MSDPINLRQARKAKARADKEKHAAENRARFGRPKAEREVEAAREVQRRKLLDGHSIDVAPAPTPGSPQESGRGPRK